MGIAVRRAGANDLGPTLDLLAECGLPTADVTVEGLRHFLVAEGAGQAGTLAGVVGLEPYGSVGLLRSLAVRESARGHGVARTLVHALEDDALGQDIEQLFLLTTDADGYFERRGYDTVERDDVPDLIRATREFSDLCPASAHVMKKRLGS